VDFTVHKSVLCQSSSFFERALGGDWQKKKNNVIELPEDNPEVFEEYFAWLYNKASFSCATLFGGPKTEATVHFEHMRELWVYGDKVLDHDFCDMIVDATISTAELVQQWPWESVFMIYKVCGPNAPVRRFLVDMYIHIADAPRLAEENRCTILNEDAYREIINAFILRKSKFSI